MKCFTTSYWLSAVCVCEGIYVCRALLWWCMWCVYVICTCSCMGVRAGPHLYTESIFMRRFLSKCLTSLPVLFFSLAFLFSFILPFNFHSHCLKPPATTHRLSMSKSGPPLFLRSACLHLQTPSSSSHPLSPRHLSVFMKQMSLH